jgi:NADH:ubiquinone oxidoreductase subunit C
MSKDLAINDDAYFYNKPLFSILTLSSTSSFRTPNLFSKVSPKLSSASSPSLPSSSHQEISYASWQPKDTSDNLLAKTNWKPDSTRPTPEGKRITTMTTIAAATSGSSPADSTPAHAASPPPTPTPSHPSPAKQTVVKKEPEPPAFEKELVSQITSKFGQDKIKVAYIKPLRLKINVDPSDIVQVASFIRDTLGFDHAESVAGTDYPKDNQIEILYHLGSYSREDLGGHILSLATRINRNDAISPSLTNVYRSVEFHERETFEMLGVYFEGHPRNERFLLPEDWADIPPLRKEFRIKGR